MGRKRTTHCLRGHERTPESTRVDKNGLRFCRHCDALRSREKRKKMATATTDAVQLTEDALEALQKAYAADPTNPVLGQQYGTLVARYAALKKAAMPKVTPPAIEVVTPLGDNDAWLAAIGEYCPGCGGWGAGVYQWDEPLRTHGYVIRLGERGARCALCRHEWKV